MFRNWFHERARRQAYLTCQHKERIDALGRGLLAQRYRKRVVSGYLPKWLHFASYLENRGLDRPTDFYDPVVQEYLHLPKGQVIASTQRLANTAVRIFAEADDEGRFRRRRPRPGKAYPVLYQQWVPSYLEFLREHRGIGAYNVAQRARHLAAFFRFLEQFGLSSLEQLTAREVHDFTAGLIHLKPGTRRQCGQALGGFFRWSRAQGMLSTDLSAAIMKPVVYRDRALIHPLPETAVSRLLEAVDRTQPLGKRDYAMLVLACQYGLRVSDIRRLRLEAIDWRARVIRLQQAKTGRELVLPLLGDVADALVDYLRHGRPPASAREVFVRHQAPHEALGPHSNLYRVMERYRHRAGLDLPPGQRGFHSLRHTFATQLVRRGHSLKLVAEVLGHTSMRSTFLYTKSDFGALRAAALGWRDRVRPSLAAAATTTRYQYGRDDLTALREVSVRPKEVRS